MSCERSNHLPRDYKDSLGAKTPAFHGNTNQKAVQKQRKFGKGHLKIVELGSEEDSVNKQEVHYQPSDVLSRHTSLFTVQLHLEGEEVEPVVDTAASASAVARRLACKLGMWKRVRKLKSGPGDRSLLDINFVVNTSS